MAWGGSAVFASYVWSAILNDVSVSGAWGGGDAIVSARYYFALYDATVTPDAFADEVDTFYRSGTWTDVAEAAGGAWPAGGIPGNLTAGTPVGLPGGTALHHPALSLSAVTVHGVSGDLCYDHATGRGLGFHDFGGPVDVDTGSLIMTWDDPPGVICINWTPGTGPARRPRPRQQQPQAAPAKPRKRRARR
jgi:hypothetical protein